MSTKKGFIDYLKYKYQATYISWIKSDQDAYVFFSFFFFIGQPWATTWF